MNFQMCQQSPGTYLMLKGIPTRFEFKTGAYGTYGLGELQDQTGQVEKMFFASSDKSPLPQQNPQGQPCIWSVIWDANKQKYKAYFKSFAQDANMNAPQNPPQTPLRAGLNTGQATNAPQTAHNRDVSIERQCVWKGACELMAQRANLPDFNGIKAELAELLVMGHDWVATGKVDFKATHEPVDNGPDEDEEIPF